MSRPLLTGPIRSIALIFCPDQSLMISTGTDFWSGLDVSGQNKHELKKIQLVEANARFKKTLSSNKSYIWSHSLVDFKNEKFEFR